MTAGAGNRTPISRSQVSTLNHWTTPDSLGWVKRRSMVNRWPQTLWCPASGAWSDFETIFENLNLVLDLREDDNFHRWIVHFHPWPTCIYNGKISQVCMAWFTANLSVKKTCERRFDDVHSILNLQQWLEFVWYSSIVVVALPHEFRRLPIPYSGKYT